MYIVSFEIDWQYLSNLWPQLGLYPQRWDNERFKALKVSDLECLRLEFLTPGGCFEPSPQAT